MNYVLGSIKCSGKQHPYPTEFERLHKEAKEKKFKNVIDQARSNTENLNVLDKKITSESANITAILQSNIENITQALHEDSKEWKQEMKSLKNDLTKVQQKITEDFNQKLRMGLDLVLKYITLQSDYNDQLYLFSCLTQN